jgi:hypothetical protein
MMGTRSIHVTVKKTESRYTYQHVYEMCCLEDEEECSVVSFLSLKSGH